MYNNSESASDPLRKKDPQRKFIQKEHTESCHNESLYQLDKIRTSDSDTFKGLLITIITHEEITTSFRNNTMTIKLYRF